ncbi:hypothetical protein M8494_03225 [Serratia ureilytica]
MGVRGGAASTSPTSSARQVAGAQGHHPAGRHPESWTVSKIIGTPSRSSNAFNGRRFAAPVFQAITPFSCAAARQPPVLAV